VCKSRKVITHQFVCTPLVYIADKPKVSETSSTMSPKQNENLADKGSPHIRQSVVLMFWPMVYLNMPKSMVISVKIIPSKLSKQTIFEYILFHWLGKRLSHIKKPSAKVGFCNEQPLKIQVVIKFPPSHRHTGQS